MLYLLELATPGMRPFDQYLGQWEGRTVLLRKRIRHSDCRSVRDCELFCRLVFGEQDSAHQIVPIPFRPVELSSKLKFGYYFSG